MLGDRLRTNILAMRVLPNADAALRAQLGCEAGERSLGVFTADCDDVSYAALDEATKKAEVRVVYARSMYAGSGNASTRLAGEFIGILAGPDPAQVQSGLAAAAAFIANDAAFYSADAQDRVVYFAHCVSRTGRYLSAQANVPAGTAMAYLIAPPLEATVALDAALKAADVELKVYYGPPSETNFAGALLTGEQAACQAACDAFAQEVCKVAAEPLPTM
ncbi:MAG: ethanolamine utilization microcompartment protein EutL [Oscillospiraceae bacterium]|jgi:ethanolamine utilization protein EutL|nr:ethanolamine utilization microcompartment protein EutL [Oscillospiraceae bacterium]